MQPPRWQQLHKHKKELTEQSEAKLKQVNKQQLHDKYQWNKCIFLKEKISTDMSDYQIFGLKS